MAGSDTSNQPLDVVGRGWAFPFAFDPASGGVQKDAPASDTQRVQRTVWAIEQVIGVTIADMFFARKFGSGVRGMIGRPNDGSLATMVQFTVVQAIERWVRWVRLTSQQVYPSATDPSVLLIKLSWLVKRTQQKGSLVYPLYLTSAEAANAAAGFGQ